MCNLYLRNDKLLFELAYEFNIVILKTISSSMRLGGYNASAAFGSAAAAAYSQMLNFNVGQLANGASNGTPVAPSQSQPATESQNALHPFHSFQTAQSHARQFSNTSTNAGGIGTSVAGITATPSIGQNLYDAFSSGFLGGSYSRGPSTIAQPPGTP